MKRPFELVAEIQEKDAEIAAMAKLAVLLKADLAEKDAEIERLRDTIAAMENAFVMRANAERELLEETLESYKSLLARAADALEKYTLYPIGMAMSVTLRESGRSVLAELRKAAE